MRMTQKNYMFKIEMINNQLDVLSIALISEGRLRGRFASSLTSLNINTAKIEFVS
jgi:hypothetical protein